MTKLVLSKGHVTPDLSCIAGPDLGRSGGGVSR
jgi:hypothetical protein